MTGEPRRTSPWDEEPTIIATLITAMITLAISFGVDITGEQQGAIITIVVIVAGLMIRRNVYAPSTVEEIVNEVAVHPSSPDHPYLP